MGFCLDFTAFDSDILCFRSDALVLCDSFLNGFWFFYHNLLEEWQGPEGIWNIVDP